MTATRDDRNELLTRARQQLAANDVRAVVELLSALPAAELVAEPEAGFLLATALRRTGEAGRAFELVRALGPASERRGRDRLWRNLLNLEAALRFDAGDVEEAEAGWQGLVQFASEAGDAELLSRAHNNLSVVYTLQGRWEEALASGGHAIAACHRLGDRRGLAQAHQNLAIAYRELGFEREADAHFRSAIDNASAVSSEDVVGRAEEERALLFLVAGDAQLAAATAQRALKRFRRIGDPAGVGEALRVLGVISLAGGNAREARDRLDDALARAREIGAALLEAETLEALAALARLEGTASQDAETRAEQVFARVGAAGWGARVREHARRFAAKGESIAGLS